MKPRKNGESDADYIRRLETANSDLRASNSRLAKTMAMYDERARPAASHARAVLLAAAEACGMSGDESVKKTAECLDALAGLPWSRDIPHPGYMLEYPAADDECRGDAEMVLRSVYERVLGDTTHFSIFSLFSSLPAAKADVARSVVHELCRLAQANLEGQARAVIGRPARAAPVVPPLESLEAAQAAFDELRHEVWMLFEDLEMSRHMLRLDLRASMYEAIAQGVARIAGATTEAADQLPRAYVQNGESLPFGRPFCPPRKSLT